MPQTKKPFICECGEPAIKKDSCHDPVCAGCLYKQSVRDLYAKKTLTCGVPDSGKDEYYNRRASKRSWINEPDKQPILFPDAIKRLEDFLQRACQPAADIK